MAQPDGLEIRDVADGLWLWRQRHPAWREGMDWRPEVASFAAPSRGARSLVAPLAPPPAAREVWDRIEAFAPDTVVVLKPDHVRDVDLFVAGMGGTPTVRACSGAATHRAPSCGRSSRAASCRAA